LVRLRRPSGREIEAVLGSGDPFSYSEVGQSAQLDGPGVREVLASRYDVDRHQYTLGRGRGLFERAQSSLMAWRQFDIPWLEFHGARRVEPDQVVATLVSMAGMWFLNPCRVVYSEFSPDANSVAYAYGTLRGHAECGEERFRVSFDPVTEEVRYEIAAFSRPAIVLSKLGYPLARRLQKRFVVSSAHALARATAS
jgi:uncharacterized protein (UPF0548 family)